MSIADSWLQNCEESNPDDGLDFHASVNTLRQGRPGKSRHADEVVGGPMSKLTVFDLCAYS